MLTSKDKEKIIRIYQEGNYSIRGIGKLLGIPKSTLHDYIQKYLRESEDESNIISNIMDTEDKSSLFVNIFKDKETIKNKELIEQRSVLRKPYDCIYYRDIDTSTPVNCETDNSIVLGNRIEEETHNMDDIGNILVIGDLHIPFAIDGYLEFCYSIYKKYNCNRVIQIGDLIDSHASSFHTSDPDGMSAGDELYSAKKIVKEWYRVFPKMDITLGNHDQIYVRKVFSSGLSKQWVKGMAEVFDTPGWNFVPEVIYDDVLYRHGVGMLAIAKAGKEFMSVVQGHFHSLANINWHIGTGKKIFSMQVPTGIDDKTYAFEYAKPFPKSALGCSVVLDNGRLPIIEMM